MAQRKLQGNTRIVGLNCIFIFASFSKGNPDIQTQIQSSLFDWFVFALRAVH